MSWWDTESGGGTSSPEGQSFDPNTQKTTFAGEVGAPALSATESISAPIVNSSSYNPTTQETTFPGAVVAPSVGVVTKWTSKERTNPFGSAAQFPFFDAAWQSYVAGTSSFRIGAAGDSTTQGICGDVYPNRRSWFTHFGKRLLDSYGISPAEFMLPPTIIDSNSCWTLGSGWMKVGLGAGNGACIECPVGVSTSTTWKNKDSSVAWDTAKLFFLKASGGGTFTVTATGGTPVAGTCSGSATYAYGSVTCSAAARSHDNSITITPDANQHLWIVGVEYYDSTGKFVGVSNYGVGGSSVTGWATTNGGLTADAIMSAVGSKLTFVSLGINNSASSVSTYTTNLQTAVSRIAAYSDVILLSPFLLGPARVSENAKMDQFEDALNTITGVAKVVKLRNIMRSRNMPFWSGSDLHLSATGYKMTADMIWEALIP